MTKATGLPEDPPQVANRTTDVRFAEQPFQLDARDHTIRAPTMEVPVKLIPNPTITITVPPAYRAMDIRLQSDANRRLYAPHFRTCRSTNAPPCIEVPLSTVNAGWLDSDLAPGWVREPLLEALAVEMGR